MCLIARANQQKEKSSRYLQTEIKYSSDYKDYPLVIVRNYYLRKTSRQPRIRHKRKQQTNKKTEMKMPVHFRISTAKEIELDVRSGRDTCRELYWKTLLMELNKNCLSRDCRKFYRISLVIFLRYFFAQHSLHSSSDFNLGFASSCENGCKLPCIKSNLFSVIYFDVWCSARTQFKLGGRLPLNCMLFPRVSLQFEDPCHTGHK